MNQLEIWARDVLARDRIEQYHRGADRRGYRRSARIIALEIRRSRRHADR
jgi:hypothetical protein